MRQGLRNGTVSVRLSVCLSHLSTAVAACGGFAALGQADRRYRLTAARSALSSTCEQCYVISCRRKLNTELFAINFAILKNASSLVSNIVHQDYHNLF